MQNLHSIAAILAILAIAASAARGDDTLAAMIRLPSVAPSNIQRVDYQQEAPSPPAAPPEILPKPEHLQITASDLTLADLEGMAQQHNPAIAQAAALVAAARGNWLQSGLAPNPVVGYSGQQLGSRGEGEQQGVYIGQELITGKKLRLNRQVAAWEVQRKQREFDMVRLSVLTDVRIGYYEVLIAQQRRELTSGLVGVTSQGSDAAAALFKAGEVSEADPLRAQVESDSAGILLQKAVNQHVESWRRLVAFIGMPELALQRLEGDLNANQADLSWHETLQNVLRQSPEVAAVIADVEARRWALKRAHAEVIPNVDVQAVIQDDRSTGSTNGNLQVTLPIPLWNRNQGRIQQAEAEVAAAQRSVDRAALDLQARLAVAFQRYETAHNQVDQYSRTGGILDKAERTLALIRAGYGAEEFGLLDLLSAQRTYFQANLSYLDAMREFWISSAEIEGLLLREGLQK